MTTQVATAWKELPESSDHSHPSSHPLQAPNADQLLERIKELEAEAAAAQAELADVKELSATQAEQLR